MIRQVLQIVFGMLCAQANCQPLIIAHRGASAHAPENSLSAFEMAIKMGADYIEFDLHQTADSVVVVMHDFTVNRTCNIPESILKKHASKKINIKDLSASEFAQLRLKKSSEHPPTFDETLKLINGRCKLLIEVKKGSDLYPGIENHILEIIKQNKAESWVNMIHSFDKNALMEIHKQNTGIKLQKLIVLKLPISSFTFSKKLDKDNFGEWQGVNIYHRFVRKRIVRKLHEQGKTVYAWTVNKKRIAKRMIRRGIDGIITNKPYLLK